MAMDYAFGAAGGEGGDLISFESDSQQFVFARAGVVAENGAAISYGSAKATSASVAASVAIMSTASATRRLQLNTESNSVS